MGEALDIICPKVQFLSICELAELKKQVICSQKTVVGQALDKSYRNSHSRREETEGKMELPVPGNFEI